MGDCTKSYNPDINTLFCLSLNNIPQLQQLFILRDKPFLRSIILYHYHITYKTPYCKQNQVKNAKKHMGYIYILFSNWTSFISRRNAVRKIVFRSL